MLRSLTVEKETVGECMFWCLQHADAAEEVCKQALWVGLEYTAEKDRDCTICLMHRKEYD